MGSFTADAFLLAGFTANAVVTDGSLVKHYRNRDHQGTDGESVVVISGDLDGFVATELSVALRELWTRIYSTEYPFFTADASIV